MRGLKRRRRRPHDPIKVALMLIKAEANAVTTRKPKKMPAIVNHDQLLKLKNAATGEEGKVDPIMLKCMQELKDHRQAKVEDVLKKVGKTISYRLLQFFTEWGVLSVARF